MSDSISISVTETPTYVTVDETNNTVTLNQSDNPITIDTTLSLVRVSTNSDDISVSSYRDIIPGGTLTSALQILADQFYRQPEEPTGSNLSEGDLWYDTDDDQLKVYRETSSNVFQFVPLAAATDTMDNLDGGQF